jgi:hypothetical protein
MVVAFINGDFIAFLPGEKSLQAVGAKIFDFVMESFVKLKKP